MEGAGAGVGGSAFNGALRATLTSPESSKTIFVLGLALLGFGSA
jgi:hypothetical protein